MKKNKVVISLICLGLTGSILATPPSFEGDILVSTRHFAYTTRVRPVAGVASLFGLTPDNIPVVGKYHRWKREKEMDSKVELEVLSIPTYEENIKQFEVTIHNHTCSGRKLNFKLFGINRDYPSPGKYTLYQSLYSLEYNERSLGRALYEKEGQEVILSFSHDLDQNNHEKCDISVDFQSLPIAD